nr:MULTISPECIES: CarD family transcriptional regulator [Deinococcus]
MISLKPTAFRPGDRVVLPPYGIGVICGTCARPLGCETLTYYQIEFQHTSSRAFVPVQSSAPTGMRPALSPADLPTLLHALQNGELDLPRQWSVRHQRVTALLASGEPYELAAMIGQFHRWNLKRALPDLDRQAFRRGVKLLMQEVEGLTGKTAQTIQLFLERALLEPQSLN